MSPTPHLKWMEIAWAEVGVREIAGPKANPRIIEYFREVGRADIVSDETAWCAAFVGYCLWRSGIEPSIPRGDELLASSYLEVGTPIDTLRVGAICCVKRNGGSGYHVALVAGWSDTHVKLLGGNQADSVSEAWFPRSLIAELRWPPVNVTPEVLAAQGSRIAKASKQQKKDGAKGTGAEVLGHVAEYGAEAAGLAAVAAKKAQHVDVAKVAEQASTFQNAAETLEKFVLFVVGKGGLIGTAIAIYFLARMAWNAGWIGHWRAEDASEGKTGS